MGWKGWNLLGFCGRVVSGSRRLCVQAEKKMSPQQTPDTAPDFKHFLRAAAATSPSTSDVPTSLYNVPPYLHPTDVTGSGRKVYFDVYGCQMNVNDTEIAMSILESAGFTRSTDISSADVILMMTCAIRENAEKKIWNKLFHYRHLKKKRTTSLPPLKIGILGCMAERLKSKLLEKEGSIDLICGPDSYKDLPRLLAVTDGHSEKAVNVLLSLDETYADIIPVRMDSDSVTAYVSIMRGCDNMCTYCIVPFTRGRERSRPVDSILKEVVSLADQGVKEITLLGQNVNSYRDVSEGRGLGDETVLAPGFSTVYKSKKGGVRFSQLLDRVASAVPDVRIRFTSPHPKDFPLEVLESMAKHKNICKSLHVPAQSGSDKVLERMRRGYTHDAYLKLIAKIQDVLPGVTLSSDFICGFCGETEDDFQCTLDLMASVRYNMAYLFAFSMREKTTAHRRYQDDVEAEVKRDRLLRMTAEFRKHAHIANQTFLHTQQLVLVQGVSKRSDHFLQGRTDGNIKVVIPSTLPLSSPNETSTSPTVHNLQKGDYVTVEITECNSQVLKGIPLCLSSLSG